MTDKETAAPAAESNSNSDSGSKDRATVALVQSEVKEVKAIIVGHAETTAAKLDALRERLTPLAGIPERVARLEERVSHVESTKVWRRGALLTAGIFSVGMLVNLCLSLHWFGL